MPHNTYLKQITEMAKIDQDLRSMALRAAKVRSTPGPGIENYMIYAVDWVHGQKLQVLIRKYGYPSKKSFGDEGMESFWILVQHQDYNVELQERCLNNCTFSKVHYEHLVDRILVNQGKMQIYGTQFTGKLDEQGNPIPWPIRSKKKTGI